MNSSSSSSSFNTSTPNFDNLLLQSLMGRLQLTNPPHPHPQPSLHSLSSLLLDDDYPFTLSSSDEEQDYDEFSPYDLSTLSPKSNLAKEEARLEKDIVKLILTGQTDTLKPNSGQAVSIGEHHICVGFHEEVGSDYRVWEWHGHIMLFDDEAGYTPEYIYGNYFERVVGGVGVRPAGPTKVKDKEKEEKVVNGLKELIKGEENGAGGSGGRVLHRSLHAGVSGGGAVEPR